MWATFVWAVALAPAQRENAVGLVWHPQATAEAADHQRLVEAVASELGVDQSDVLDHALTRARRVIAHQIDVLVVETALRLDRRLREADLAFRHRQLDTARELATEVWEGLDDVALAPSVVRLAIRCQLLLARTAWTQGDSEETLRHMEVAIRLDPEGRLSTRRVPPDFADAFADVRRRVNAQRDTWTWPSWGIPAGAAVEIDGIVGLRPIPPGRHVVTVRRMGVVPVGVMLDGPDDPWVVPEADVRLRETVPIASSDQVEMCSMLGIEDYLLVDRRSGGWALQRTHCGHGRGQPVFVGNDALRSGVMAAIRSDVRDQEPPFMRPWPVTSSNPEPKRSGVPAPNDGPRPWYRRAWIWVLVGTVVAGAVAGGVVAGTRPREQRVIEVPGDFVDR